MRSTSLLLALAAIPAISASPRPDPAPVEHHLEKRLTLVNTASATLGTFKAGLIQTVLAQTANLSWEIGTHAEALTEYLYPTLSVFASNPFPPPTTPVATPVLNIATSVILNKTANTLPFMADGAPADPASIGQAVLLANWTIGANYTTYNTDAAQELYFILNVVPRTADGAISHRIEQTQLWSDSVYMVPPFLAYYGALTSNATLFQAAYDQIRLYRNYLGAPNYTTGGGLWRHQALGTTPDNNDNGAWATGNAWAAAGIVRTLATILNSPMASQFTTQTTDLATWAQEILVPAWSQVGSDHLFLNYFNGSIYSTAVFPDTASTALMTAASYRLSSILLKSSTSSLLPASSVFSKSIFNSTSALLGNVTRSRLAVYDATSNTTGIISPAVDPDNYKAQLTAKGAVSPEAEAFVLLMEAAYTDWKAAGGQDPNIPGYVTSGPLATSGASAAVMSLGWVTMGAAIFGGLALL